MLPESIDEKSYRELYEVLVVTLLKFVLKSLLKNWVMGLHKIIIRAGNLYCTTGLRPVILASGMCLKLMIEKVRQSCVFHFITNTSLTNIMKEKTLIKFKC